MARVLFIEDDTRWQNKLQELLEIAGHEAQYVSTIDAALACIDRKKSFDVISFDLRLEEKEPNYPTFTWLHAFVDGMGKRGTRKIPIIILTGVNMTKDEIIQAFTEYQIFHLFEKQYFDPEKFLSCIKKVESDPIFEQPKSKSLLHVLFYTILIVLIMLIIFQILLWSVKQIPDPKTQQSIIQVGGSVLIIMMIFIAVLSQNTKIEKIVEIITKIWRS